MQKDIIVLLKVQEIDLKINSLKRESRILPEELNSVKAEVQGVENRLKEKQEEFKKMQVARKDMEIDVETKQGNVKKFETQLFQIKTNEEYKAMQKQINDLRFEYGLVEDKILEKMEEIEKIQLEVKKIGDELKKAKDTLVQKEREISAEIDAVNADIQSIQKQREETAKDVSPEFLAKYELILKNKGGAAIVPIENKACQGCHMSLPPNVVNEVKKSTKVVICDNCSRILYYP